MNNFKFKEIREKKGLLQREVAVFLQISRGQYAVWEAEIGNIPLFKLIEYCNKFCLSLDYVANITESSDISCLNYVPSPKEIGVKLFEFRKEIKKSQQQMALILGITRSAYNKYENGYRTIQALMLRYLALKYNYSLDWFVCRSSVKHPNTNIHT